MNGAMNEMCCVMAVCDVVLCVNLVMWYTAVITKRISDLPPNPVIVVLSLHPPALAGLHV